MQRRHRRIPRRAVVPRDAPERERTEFSGHDDRAAGRQRRQRRRHEAVHVKQRHHAQRHIVRRQRVAACDVARRDGEVGVLERHALGPAGAAARVQDERDVIDVGRLNGPPAGDPGKTHRARGVHLDGENRHAVAGCAPRFLCPTRRQQEDTGVGVVQIKAELVFLVPRIQRRRSACDGRGQKRHDGRKPVGERHADAVAPADARRGERLGDRLHLARELSVGDANILVCVDDGCLVRGNRAQQAKQRCWRSVQRIHDVSSLG